MYINPQTAIDEGWVTGIENPEKQVQPNAIDFTLDKLFTINHNNVFVICEDFKTMRGGKPFPPVLDQQSGLDMWWITGPSTFDGMSDVSVKLPEGVACELIIRSTFNRNGLFLTSGLYDSGYEGPIGFALHNRSGMAKIAVGTRIGQIKFVASDSAGKYAGGYNHKDGTHWSDSEQHSDRGGGILHNGEK